ncbi:MAG: hypothetical protein ACPGRX_05435 [Bdellovibrionales bacterium]
MQTDGTLEQPQTLTASFLGVVATPPNTASRGTVFNPANAPPVSPNSSDVSVSLEPFEGAKANLTTTQTLQNNDLAAVNVIGSTTLASGSPKDNLGKAGLRVAIDLPTADPRAGIIKSDLGYTRTSDDGPTTFGAGIASTAPLADPTEQQPVAYASLSYGRTTPDRSGGLVFKGEATQGLLDGTTKATLSTSIEAGGLTVNGAHNWTLTPATGQERKTSSGGFSLTLSPGPAGGHPVALSIALSSTLEKDDGYRTTSRCFNASASSTLPLSSGSVDVRAFGEVCEGSAPSSNVGATVQFDPMRVFTGRPSRVSATAALSVKDGAPNVSIGISAGL